MKLEPSLEYCGPQHAGILAAAALSGCQLAPVIQGAQRLIAFGKVKYGYGPGCVIDVIMTDHVIEPHVIWFPWTTPANRVIGFKWAMKLMSETHTVLLNVEKKHAGFFDYFARKGFLRKIGYIEKLPIVEEIHMYQVKRSSS